MFQNPSTPSSRNLIVTEEAEKALDQILAQTHKYSKGAIEGVEVRKSFSKSHRKLSIEEENIAQYRKNELLRKELEKIEQDEFLFELDKNPKVQCLDKDLFVYHVLDYRIFFALIQSADLDQKPEVAILKVASKAQLEQDGALYTLPSKLPEDISLKSLLEFVQKWLQKIYCDVFSVRHPYSKHDVSKRTTASGWRSGLKMRNYKKPQESPNTQKQHQDGD